jgi:galactokinase
MDQFVVRLAEKGKAIFLNCGDLSYEQVPFPGQKIKVLVCNTMVKRNLKNSNYNRRREECQEAVEVLKKKGPVHSLGEIDEAGFEKYKDVLTPALRKRARHVISENERVRKAVSFFKSMDFSSLGECMYQSHYSLRDDYEVSCPELDLMVELARGVEGTWGSRMTGAGFGGCTVNLVSLGFVDLFRQEVSRGYQKRTGITPEIYASSVEGGVSRLE